MPQLNIAVVGAGVSGLAAAWLLSKRHRVTLFEREPRLGGHANTIDVATPDGNVPIDTGFIVYNTATYPNLTALFDYLDVPTSPSCMSFAVSLAGGDYEYSGTGLQGLFGQRSNALCPSHLRLVAEIARFFREASALARSGHEPNVSLGDWLSRNNYSQAFIAKHLLPMGAAIWSVPAAQMMAFPVAAFVRFFSNHGLLKVRDRPKWRTVEGGSREYVGRLAADFDGSIRTNFDVVSIARGPHGVDVTASNGVSQRFDHCVLAGHADQSLAVLADPDAEEHRILSAFRYSSNTAVLHSDSSLMPKRHRLWSSWNYVATKSSAAPGVSYWMNRLQPLATAKNYFVTLNPDRPVDPATEVARFNYQHPVFDNEAMRLQKELWSLQGRNRLWFAGSYFGYGFHEDGLQAGLAVAEELGGVRRPWSVTNESDRLSFPVAAPSATILEAAQ